MSFALNVVCLSLTLCFAAAQFGYEPGTFDGVVSNGRGGLGHLEKHRQHHDVSYYNAYNENPFGGAPSSYHYGFATNYRPATAAASYNPYQFGYQYRPFRAAAWPFNG